MNFYDSQDEKLHHNRIDRAIGGRIKELRLIRGMSQSDLGKKIGITFQQIQKYEKGTNRVLVSRLYDLANALSIDIQYFFSDLSYTECGTTTALSENNNEPFKYNDGEDTESKEILELVRKYQKIKSKRLRGAIYSLVKSLSQDLI